ncbi:hypothetical protein D3C71_1464210 [compost metagenome]
MPLPAVSRLGAKSVDAFFTSCNRFQVSSIRFRTVNRLQIVLLDEVFTDQHRFVRYFRIIVRNHEQLAVHLGLIPSDFIHGGIGLRRVFLQHIVGQLQEAAFQRLVVIVSPVRRIYQIEIFIGREFQRVFLVPVRPVQELDVHGSVDFLLQQRIQFIEYFVVIRRLAADQNHFQLNLFGCIRSPVACRRRSSRCGSRRVCSSRATVRISSAAGGEGRCHRHGHGQQQQGCLLFTHR